jgi:hypothetical protein
MIPGQQDRKLGTSLSFMGESETIVIIINNQKNFILYSSSTNTGKSSCFSSTCPSISLSVSSTQTTVYYVPQPYSSPLSKHNLQPSMIKRFHCPNRASSQQFLIHHNQAFQTEPPKTDEHHTSCYCPLNETPLLSRISSAILGNKVSP